MLSLICECSDPSTNGAWSSAASSGMVSKPNITRAELFRQISSIIFRVAAFVTESLLLPSSDRLPKLANPKTMSPVPCFRFWASDFLLAPPLLKQISLSRGGSFFVSWLATDTAGDRGEGGAYAPMLSGACIVCKLCKFSFALCRWRRFSFELCRCSFVWYIVVLRRRISFEP